MDDLSTVFLSIDEGTIGAGSIGQVHRATLLDGTQIVLKVQYPEVERYFRLDFETMKLMCRYIGGKYDYYRTNLDVV